LPPLAFDAAERGKRDMIFRPSMLRHIRPLALLFRRSAGLGIANPAGAGYRAN
jgi:hypothetical protein